MTTLTFSEAKQSPCNGCSAPCCSYLPLHDFVIQHFDHLDYAFYLLNFAHIELALVNGNSWRVHYRQPCSRLLPTGGCRLHGQPEKPMVCQNYSATTCFYKSMFIQPETDAFLRFNYDRLKAYANLMTFDDNRNVTGIPDASGLKEQLPIFVEEEIPEVSKPLTHHSRQAFRFMDFPNPCDRCTSWCCSTLSFPFAGISARANLDYLWFCLGFPGIELNFAADQWSILVNTHCRNLLRSEDGVGRCGVFNQPERPHHCEQYDAMQCGYKQQYLSGSTGFSTRVNLDKFSTLAEHYVFDDVGQLLQQPSFESLKRSLSTT